MPRRHLARPRDAGERLADRAVATLGSWTFLLAQAAVIAGWIGWQSVPALPHFDNPQLTILNLLLSTQAAIAAPLILLSQRRQGQIDQRRDEHEAAEVEQILALLAHLKEHVS